MELVSCCVITHLSARWDVGRKGLIGTHDLPAVLMTKYADVRIYNVFTFWKIVKRSNRLLADIEMRKVQKRIELKPLTCLFSRAIRLA